MRWFLLYRFKNHIVTVAVRESIGIGYKNRVFGVVISVISLNANCVISNDIKGGYIDLTINEISGKTVKINSITVTYFKLTNANPTVIVGGNEVTGVSFTPENTELYGFTYEVNASTVRIQNRYNETINHWSVLPLCEITINYSII